MIIIPISFEAAVYNAVYVVQNLYKFFQAYVELTSVEITSVESQALNIHRTAPRAVIGRHWVAHTALVQKPPEKNPAQKPLEYKPPVKRPPTTKAPETKCSRYKKKPKII